ncbi:hypothetical protein EII31_02895 [Leucobacter sp. OH2974_COT-288]|nr:hypothetical protein EII31_02895 [Leucobacter sp. OH2974_COT-288]
MPTTPNPTENQKPRLSDYQLDNWLNELKKQDPDIVEKIEKALQETSKSEIPGETNIFRAYELTPFHKVKVVILGNDPYPDKGAADGLAFSYSNGQPARNKAIKKILSSVNRQFKGNRTDYTLDDWADQGVLLLNTSLTFPLEPLSRKRTEHRKHWKPLIDATLTSLLLSGKTVVFLIWGRKAENVFKRISKNIPISNNIKIIISAHPTAGSSSFRNSNCFEQANVFLAAHKETKIDWLGL